MRLLVDQNLAYRLALLLIAAGHDVVHTEDVKMATTSDPQILAWCCTHERLLVTADKKLTKFLASSAADCPSVLIIRGTRTSPSDEIAAIVVANLPQIERIIADHGSAVFSLAPDKPIRAEFLPLGVQEETS